MKNKPLKLVIHVLVLSNSSHKIVIPFLLYEFIDNN
jgi:hypothetical protein